MLQYKDSDKYSDFMNAGEETQFWEEYARLQTLLLMPLQLIGESESDGSNFSQVYTYFQKLMLNPIYSDAELVQMKKMEFHPY